MIPFLIGAAAVAVAGSTAAWIFNSMTESETRRHSELKSKIGEYNGKYQTILSQHNSNIRELERNTFFEIKKEFVEQVNFFRNEKSPIKNDLLKLKHALEEEIKNESISPYARKALLFERNRIEDAFSRLDAYWSYLKWYEEKLQYFEEKNQYKAIQIFEQPNALLPNDFLYAGKLAKITESELNQWNGYGQKLELNSTKVNNEFSKKQEEENLLFYVENKINEIPIFIDYVSNSNKFFKASIAKAELWQSILAGSQIEAKPFEDEKPNSKGFFIDYKGVRGILHRKDKCYPLKNYRKNFSLNLTILENNFLLTNVVFTEKNKIEEDDRKLEVIIVFDKENIINDTLESLDKYLNTFNLSVANIDIQEKTVLFKISDLNIHCKIEDAKGCLSILNINTNSIDSSKSFEPPYSFLFIPIETFNPELYFSLKDNFVEFIAFCNNQFQFGQYSKDNNYEDYNFFRKWNEVLDYQINANSFSEECYQYNKINVESGFINIFLDKKTFHTIHEKIEKINGYKNKPIINIEFKEDELDCFKCIDIGVIDDIDTENKEMSVIIGIEINDSIVFNTRNEFILKTPDFQTALIKQKNALKDFAIGKIINSNLKAELISPCLIKSTVDGSWVYILSNKFEWKNKDLTENQKKTIEKVLLEKNISLIQGPPGTGKTTIIKEIAYQQLKHKPNEKVLIVSQQNVAVDNALSRIYQENRKWFDSSKFSFIRIAPNEKKVSQELKPFTLENWFKNYKDKLSKSYSEIIYNTPSIEKYCNEWWSLINKDELKDIDSEIIEILINSHNIIGATCVGLANRSIGLDLIEFDIVIIDEAGRATPPELLIPILRAKKVVLIGDHYQLPPQYDRKLLAALENDDDGSLSSFDKEFFEKSFFERLYENLPSTNKNMLIDQFRMPKEVGSLISKIFYEGSLANGIEKNTIDFYNPINTIIWVDVKGQQKYEGKSSYNEHEVEKISSLLKDINLHLKSKKTVAIITPYSAQKKRIKNTISSFKLDNISNIKIDTVDSFQGEEAQIVIYSTVRTHGNLSFLIDRKRLNVAISRTQENLIFVGHKNFLEKAEVNGKTNLFKEIIDYVNEVDLITELRREFARV